MGPIPDMGHLDVLVALQNRVAKKFASGCGTKLGIMRGFQKGITLGGLGLLEAFLWWGCKIGLQKNLQKFCI